MADGMTSTWQLTREQRQDSTKDILNGLSSYRIDPFRIKSRDTGPRARGGQGLVILATLVPAEGSATPASEQVVAVKQLEWDREDSDNSARFFRSFAKEIDLMASLSHPNIIKLIGFVENVYEGDARIILPWEGNGNVREFLQSGKWDIPERISLIQDTANGLEYLHSQKPPICHGDLKSLNILVNSSHHAGSGGTAL
ncbi:hypothetical protein M407DRAFT_22963 [Tulasnella calospora MUT 4182]|uniref:Protein kinase domain-containing protein n=1 Tax=Tulasnella calospora MUT 4182 TaxID=1051891 RepID=A0A0C3QM09_9AGAM|nr:hypothetical protein M407DRAFT_22963 [Tulasnella calospora MUT 4182]